MNNRSIRRSILILSAFCFLSSCGGGKSPDALVETLPREGLNITFEDMGVLTGSDIQIRQLVTSAYETVDDVIQVGFVQVKVLADASETIPGWGIGGYALGPHSVEIVVDANYPNLEQVLSDRLPYIVAHELHHVVRWRSTGTYETLLEALVFEGLADDFATNLLQSDQPPWTTVFDEGSAQVYFDDTLDELDGAFNFEAWFFGVNTNRPQWTGYTLGYLLVQRYRLSNSNADLPELLVAPVNNFRDLITDTL